MVTFIQTCFHTICILRFLFYSSTRNFPLWSEFNWTGDEPTNGLSGLNNKEDWTVAHDLCEVTCWGKRQTNNQLSDYQLKSRFLNSTPVFPNALKKHPEDAWQSDLQTDSQHRNTRVYSCCWILAPCSAGSQVPASQLQRWGRKTSTKTQLEQEIRGDGLLTLACDQK